MKNLICLILLIISFQGFSQTLPVTPGVTGRSLYPVEDRYLFARQHFGLPRYTDTTQANTYNGVVDSCGAQIFTYDVSAVWFRSCYNGSRQWIQIMPAGSPSGANPWLIGGNLGLFTSPVSPQYVGTKTNQGFGFLSNNIARLTITEDGAWGLGAGLDYGSSGEILTSQGAGTAPIWSAASASGITTTDSSFYLTGSGAKINARWWYNVKDYGAIPNDGLSDDVAIQDAINACHTGGGGTVYFPIGVYTLTEAPVRLVVIAPGDTVLCNSQLYIPMVKYDADTNQYRSVRLLGESPSSTEFQVVATFPNPMNGAVLNSTYIVTTDDAGGYSRNVIGALSYGTPSFNYWNYTTSTVQDIKVVVATQDSTGTEVVNKMSGISFEYCAKANLKGTVSIRTSSAPEDQLDPHIQSNGYIGPEAANHADSDNDNVFVSGFYHGVKTAEHSSFKTLVLNANYYGVTIRPYYKVIINSLITENNAYTVKMMDESNLSILGWSGEINSTPGKYYSHVADVTEATSGARGTMVVQLATINNTGVPTTPTKIGDSIRVIIQSDHYGQDYTPLNPKQTNTLNYNQTYYDSTTNLNYRWAGGLGWLPYGTGSTPTWQQTLTAGSTLTGNNTVTGGGNEFIFEDINQFQISLDGVGVNSYILLDGNGGSRIYVRTDSLLFEPFDGNFHIDTLNYSNAADDSMMVWSDANGGHVGMRAIPSGISGLTTNELVYGNSATTIASLPVATYPSLTELSYVKGLTSSAQTQINGLPTASSTTTFTNKRITQRVTTTASSATPTPDGDASDMFTVTALAAGAVFAAPTGTPTDGQALLIRIKDDGTARTLGWNAIYRESTDFALPTTTVISKTMYVQFIYNSADSKWDAVGYTAGF